ncbi:hypothetical protein LRH25_07745 [Ideonella azotifigens]|uniref:Uncharacterized protein n=1 Tax=Ideonella azotifigens TaxID=513160 RepID=A0ABP3UYW6_9BURK|nr:hypothetical protein [Ideonella azotifigens]MCD2340234.1 hypothetical protein [Ideonella azotifigens]
MSIHYVKTPAGLAEIQTKAASLSRPVRNLLLVINDSKPDSYWLQAVNGVSEADLAQLLAAGFIALAGQTGGAAAVAPPPAKAGAHAGAAAPAPAAVAEAAADDDNASAFWARVQQAIRDATYTGLYDVLTSQGKAQLGLMRGYRFVLEVEKCGGLPELQTLALRFAEQLRDDHGMAAVKRFYGALRSA